MQRVVIFIVIAAIVVWSQWGNRDEADAAIKEQMLTLVQELPCYDGEEGYVAGLFDMQHMFAFNQAYDIGGRRRAASFDEEVYFDVLLNGMIIKARDRNKPDVVECLQPLRDMLAPPSEE